MRGVFRVVRLRGEHQALQAALLQHGATVSLSGMLHLISDHRSWSPNQALCAFVSLNGGTSAAASPERLAQCHHALHCLLNIALNALEESSAGLAHRPLADSIDPADSVRRLERSFQLFDISGDGLVQMDEMLQIAATVRSRGRVSENTSQAASNIFRDMQRLSCKIPDPNR